MTNLHLAAIGIAILVITMFSETQAKKVMYKDCGSVSGTIQSVDVWPCPAEPCQFLRHKIAYVTVNFTANAAITKAKTKVYGFILGLKMPFPVPDDACKNMPCPITEGDAVTYTNSVFVKPGYPSVRVVVQWEVHDQNNNMVLCFNMPVRIKG